MQIIRSSLERAVAVYRGHERLNFTAIGLLCLLAFSISFQSAISKAPDADADFFLKYAYQGTNIRPLNSPDATANPRLFQGLKQLYLYNSTDSNEPYIDTTRAKKLLEGMGIGCVQIKAALKDDMALIHFVERPALNTKGLNCVLSISDVITVNRQSNFKYRLDWWCKHVNATTPQAGFDRLIDALIKDIKLARSLGN